jgi:hypothetical protein
MPTLLDLAGLETPSDTSGIALGPVLRGDSPQPDRLVYCDEGFDLSAYGPGGFVRVDGILAAWNSAEVGHPTSMTPRWVEYRWAPGEPWRVVDSSGEISKETIRSYFRQAIPMLNAPKGSKTREKMLRALGYGE